MVDPLMKKLLKNLGKEALDDQNQEFITTYCGQLALYFLYRINNDDSFDIIISELKNVNRYLI